MLFKTDATPAILSLARDSVAQLSTETTHATVRACYTTATNRSTIY